MNQPRLLITAGDVAGVGPEVIVRAWPAILKEADPVVVGDPAWLRRAAELVGTRLRVQPVKDAAEGFTAGPGVIPCLKAGDADLASVEPCRVSAAAGRAAYDSLRLAIDLTLAGDADGIVTAPLHKEGLRAAGVPHPGHTEVLAERTGVDDFAMLLHGPRSAPGGLTVAHVTLHVSLRDVFAGVTAANVLEKIRLLHGMVPRLTGGPARIGVAALNPHAGDGGLFGTEEAEVIAPAVAAARAGGVDVSGPWPADTLFVRADSGEFDGVVAMYHDQGHVAMKLRGGMRAVNVTAGLPLIRTSVAHGTAYDIAWRGRADATSMIAAVEVAARLARGTEENRGPHADLSDSSRRDRG